jgi:hypothetical protein
MCDTTYVQTHIFIPGLVTLHQQFMAEKTGRYCKEVSLSNIKVLVPTTGLLDDPEVLHKK